MLGGPNLVLRGPCQLPPPVPVHLVLNNSIRVLTVLANQSRVLTVLANQSRVLTVLTNHRLTLASASWPGLLTRFKGLVVMKKWRARPQ